MIQRIQTLFLIEIVFLSVSLLFIPIQFIISNGAQLPLSFMPVSNELLVSTSGHYAASVINMVAAVISLVAIFLFKKRELQLKLCYLLVVLFVILIAMVAFCPFVKLSDNVAVKDNFLAYIILVVCAVSAFMAARYVKKDIDLLKSADRIR
jgi:hypothetical protein